LPFAFRNLRFVYRTTLMICATCCVSAINKNWS